MIMQLAINAIALGAAYALVALGFVLILNATSAVNFAQGDLVAAGGFVAVALAAVLPVPGAVLVPLVLVVTALLGLAFSLLAYFPLMTRPPVSVFISTIAVGLILQHGLNALFGPEPRAAPPLFGDGAWQVAGAIIDRQAVAVILSAAVLIAGLYILLARTQLGRRMRATAQDRAMAQALGIPVGRMIAATFALGAALAGIAGLLLANRYFVTPTDGASYMLTAYIAVVIGGWGSLAGAVAGAMLIAVFEIFVSAMLSHPVAIALLYGCLLAILVLRPQGLFGERAQRRA